jgi:hypothetical protein
VHDTDGSKLDGRARIGHWLGFDTKSSGYRIYWEDTRSIGVERSVKFDENDPGFEGKVLNEGKDENDSIQQPSSTENGTNAHKTTPTKHTTSQPTRYFAFDSCFCTCTTFHSDDVQTS